jgi:hypothetical protein
LIESSRKYEWKKPTIKIKTIFTNIFNSELNTIKKIKYSDSKETIYALALAAYTRGISLI